MKLICALVLVLTFDWAAAKDAPQAPAPARRGQVTSFKELVARIDSGVEATVSANIDILETIKHKGSVVIAGAAGPATPVLKCGKGRNEMQRPAFDFSDGEVSLSNIHIAGCAGVIHVRGSEASLRLSGVTISGCSGAVWLKSHQVTHQVTECVRVWGAPVTISQSVFRGNSGGAVVHAHLLASQSFKMTDSQFLNNNASLLLNLFTPSPKSTTPTPRATDNSTRRASVRASEQVTSRARLTSCTFRGNTFRKRGKAVLVHGVVLTVNGSVFSGNTGFDSLANMRAGSLEFRDTSFLNNTGGSFQTLKAMKAANASKNITGTAAASGFQRVPALVKTEDAPLGVSLIGCKILHNQRTGGICLIGNTTWNLDSTAVDTSNKTLYNLNADWNYYNGLAKNFSALYGLRMQELNKLVSGSKQTMWLKLRDTDISHNQFIWGAIITAKPPDERNNRSPYDTSVNITLHDTRLANNIVADADVDDRLDPAPAIISATYSQFEAHRTSIVNNTAPDIVLCRYSDTMHMSNLAIEHNTARNDTILSMIVILHSRTNNLLIRNNTAMRLVVISHVRMLLNRMDVVDNTCQTGHLLNITSGEFANFTDVNIQRNTVHKGALMNFTAGNFWMIRNATVSNNNASLGGLLFTDPYQYFERALVITESSFEGNRFDNSTFGTLMLNGSLASGPNGNSKFTIINVTASTFSNNQATSDRSYGGGIHITGKWKGLNVIDTQFSNNIAAVGGGIFTSVSHDLARTVILNSTFTSNTAQYGSGGGVACSRCDIFEMSGTKLVGNRAMRGGGGLMVAPRRDFLDYPSNITNNTFEGNLAGYGQQPGQDIGWDTGKDECPVGGGGGVCVQLGNSVVLAENIIRKNNGYWGGGILVNDVKIDIERNSLAVLCRNSLQDNYVHDGGGPAVFWTTGEHIKWLCRNGTEDCQSVNLTRPRRNRGALAEEGCPEWMANRAGTNVFYNKHMVATMPKQLRISKGSLTGDEAQVMRSGDSLNATLWMADEYDNRLTRPLFHTIMLVSSSSNSSNNTSNNTSNSSDALLVYGQNGFEWNTTASETMIQNVTIQPNKIPDGSKYMLMLTAYSSLSLTKELEITIRPCKIGEQLTTTFSCLLCANGTYINDPELGSCNVCPTNGVCTNGTLVPTVGYWQSTPQSPQVHKCPLEKSCFSSSSPDRNSELLDFMFQENGTWLFYMRNTNNRTLKKEEYWKKYVEAYHRKQCHRGFEGNLCGNCMKGYGRFARTCINCPGVVANTLYILMAVLVLMVLLTITVVSHLNAVDLEVTRRRDVQPELDSEHILPSPFQSMGTPASQRTTWHSARSRSSASSTPSVLLTPAADAAPQTQDQNMSTAPERSEIDVPETAQLRQGPRSVEMSSLKSSIGDGVMLNAKKHAEADSARADGFKRLLGIMKILVSHVQVLSIMRGAQLKWPRVLQVLDRLDFTSTTNFLSIDCSLAGSSFTKAIARTTILALLPVVAAACTAVFWVMNALARRMRSHTTRRELRRFLTNRITLTVVQVFYYLYPVYTTAVFRIFTFTTIDNAKSATSTFLHKDDVKKYYLVEGRFWTEEYNTKCYQREHLAFVAVLGIPGMLFLAMGFPMWCGLKLYSKREKLETDDILLKYGFLYDEYKLPYYFWEAVIMARKALVLICTIFLAAYGPAIQLHTATAVLLISTVLQVIFKPRKVDTLDNLELLSLFTTLFSVVLLTYFLPEVASSITQGWQVLFVLLFVVGNLAVFSIFFVKIGMELKSWLDTDGDGRVSWDDFIHAMPPWIQQHLPRRISGRFIQFLMRDKIPQPTPPPHPHA